MSDILLLLLSIILFMLYFASKENTFKFLMQLKSKRFTGEIKTESETISVSGTLYQGFSKPIVLISINGIKPRRNTTGVTLEPLKSRNVVDVSIWAHDQIADKLAKMLENNTNSHIDCRSRLTII